MSKSSTISINPLFRLIFAAMPSRMKRMVFLASLTAIAKETNVPEPKLIEKLNRVMNLSATGDGALKFPIAVSSLIWADHEIFKADLMKLTQCEGTEPEAQASAEHIVGSVPEWFRYATVPAVVRDVMALFKSDNCIFPAANKSSPMQML